MNDGDFIMSNAALNPDSKCENTTENQERKGQIRNKEKYFDSSIQWKSDLLPDDIFSQHNNINL